MLRRFLNLFERNTSDDSLDFTVLFILPFSESLKWNKSSFTFICWISPAWNRVSQLIYQAVWLTIYRGLPLAGSELHGNLYVGFFMFYKPGSFLSTLYLWRILFTLEWKKKTLTWFFRYKKKIEKNWRAIDPCGHCIAHFSGIFCIYFVFWIEKTVCDIFPVYLL